MFVGYRKVHQLLKDSRTVGLSVFVLSGLRVLKCSSARAMSLSLALTVRWSRSSIEK